MSEVKPSRSSSPSPNPALTLPLALALALCLAMNVQLWTLFKEFRTYFNELWTSSSLLGPVWNKLDHLSIPSNMESI